MKIESKIVKRVATIDENKSVSDAAQLITNEFIGSVVVTNASGICGLLTERDVMMNVVGEGKDPKKVLIKDVITRAPIKVSPNDTAGTCLDLMKEHRCLHLLVFDGDEFIGTASLRDVARSPFEGPLFEGFIAAEIVKAQIKSGRRPEIYYFRDE